MYIYICIYNINKSVASANRQKGPKIADIFNNFIYHRELIINTTFEQKEKESLIRELSQTFDKYIFAQ